MMENKLLGSLDAVLSKIEKEDVEYNNIF